MRDFGQKMLEKWKMAWRDGLFHNICSVENGLYLDVMRANRGFACLPAADSGEDGAVWGRGRVDCLLPGDCRLRVYAFCSDSKALGDWPDMDEGLKSLRGQDRAETWRVLRQIYGEAVSESGEFFIPRAGRYLWIMLELISEGGGNPLIRGIEFDGVSEKSEIEADAAGDGLSLKESMAESFDTKVEDLLLGRDDRLYRCAEDWLESPELYDAADMYTVEGIKRSVERLTGTKPFIIESEAVDPNSRYCPDSELYRQLYGDDPYSFFVLLSEDSFADRDEAEAFREEMRGLIPASTEMKLVLLQNGIRLDRHSYLGINSKVGGFKTAAINGHTALQFDTMIGGNCNE